MKKKYGKNDPQEKFICVTNCLRFFIGVIFPKINYKENKLIDSELNINPLIRIERHVDYFQPEVSDVYSAIKAILQGPSLYLKNINKDWIWCPCVGWANVEMRHPLHGHKMWGRPWRLDIKRQYNAWDMRIKTPVLGTELGAEETIERIHISAQGRTEDGRYFLHELMYMLNYYMKIFEIKEKDILIKKVQEYDYNDKPYNMSLW